MFRFENRILVLDDMMVMRKIVSKACREIGFTSLAEAANGEEGWNEVSSGTEAVKIIISDWNMPVMTGLELLKKVRADERFKRIPFLLVTAEGEQTQILEAAKSGVDAYIAKPFTPETLKEKLEQVSKKYPELC